MKLGVSISVCMMLWVCGCGHGRSVSANMSVSSEAVVAGSSADLFMRMSQEVLLAYPSSPWTQGQWEKALLGVLAVDGSYAPALYNKGLLLEKGVGVEWEGLKKKAYVPVLQHVLAEGFLAGKHDDADMEKQYRVWVEANPKDAVSLLGLAVFALKNNRLQEAERYARECLGVMPSGVLAYEVMARVAYAKGQYDLALLTVQKGLLWDAKHPGLHKVRVYVALKQQGYPEAVALLQEYLKEFPEDMWGHVWLSSLALHVQDYPLALSSLDKVHAQFPQRDDVRLARGVCLAGVKRYDEALRAYDEVFQNRAYAAMALWNKAVLWEDALHEYEKAAKAYADIVRHVAVKDPAFERAVYEASESVARKIQEEAKLKEEQEREKQQQEKIQTVCAQWDSASSVAEETLGTSEERAVVAWQLLNQAQQVLASNASEAVQKSTCAFRWGTSNNELKAQVCASLYVAWAKVVFEVGCVEDALNQVHKALECDPKHQEALLIEQQLQDGVSGPSGQACPLVPQKKPLSYNGIQPSQLLAEDGSKKLRIQR